MNNTELYIPIILGTGREGRLTELVTNFVYAQAQQFGFRTKIFDVRDYHTEKTIKAEVEHTSWDKEIEQADGMIIVSPEYNHSFPGELKMFIDQAYREYNRKPAAICGVSNGAMGGVRMVEQLRSVLIELSMVNINTAVYFGNVAEQFDEKGQLTNEAFYQRMEKMFIELAWYAQALKKARQEQS